MRFLVALFCLLATAPVAQAADAPRVQVIEGAVTGETSCTALPSSADIARTLGETLSRRLGHDVAAVAPGAKANAAALKVAINVSLSLHTDNFDDGPILIVGVTERTWQGAAEEAPPDPELYGWDEHFECDERLTEFITGTVRGHAQRMAGEIKGR